MLTHKYIIITNVNIKKCSVGKIALRVLRKILRLLMKKFPSKYPKK